MNKAPDYALQAKQVSSLRHIPVLKGLRIHPKISRATARRPWVGIT